MRLLGRAALTQLEKAIDARWPGKDKIRTQMMSGNRDTMYRKAWKLHKKGKPVTIENLTVGIAEDTEFLRVVGKAGVTLQDLQNAAHNIIIDLKREVGRV